MNYGNQHEMDRNGVLKKGLKKDSIEGSTYLEPYLSITSSTVWPLLLVEPGENDRKTGQHYPGNDH